VPPIVHRSRPINSGLRPGFGFEFWESQMANIPRTSRNVPNT